MLGFAPYLSNKSVTTGNVTATWNANDKLTLSAYARNVTDERYKTSINLTTIPDPTENVAPLSEPRNYGVNLSWKF